MGSMWGESGKVTVADWCFPGGHRSPLDHSLPPAPAKAECPSVSSLDACSIGWAEEPAPDLSYPECPWRGPFLLPGSQIFVDRAGCILAPWLSPCACRCAAVCGSDGEQTLPSRLNVVVTFHRDPAKGTSLFLQMRLKNREKAGARGGAAGKHVGAG